MADSKIKCNYSLPQSLLLVFGLVIGAWFCYRHIHEHKEEECFLEEEAYLDTSSESTDAESDIDSEKQEHREALIGMRSALDTWIVETNDQGEFPEPEDVVKPFEKEMHDWFGTPSWHPYKPEKTP